MASLPHVLRLVRSPRRSTKENNLAGGFRWLSGAVVGEKIPRGRYFLLHHGGQGPMCTPHAATHVPLALSGYATTSSVLAIVWSLVRSTVSSTPPIALTGGRHI